MPVPNHKALLAKTKRGAHGKPAFVEPEPVQAELSAILEEVRHVEVAITTPSDIAPTEYHLASEVLPERVNPKLLDLKKLNESEAAGKHFTIPKVLVKEVSSNSPRFLIIMEKQLQ